MKFIPYLLASLLIAWALISTMHSQEFIMVDRVISGSICITSSSKTIQICGVNAPRTGNATSEEAAQHLGQMLSDNSINLMTDSLARDVATNTLSRHVSLSNGSLASLVVTDTESPGKSESGKSTTIGNPRTSSRSSSETESNTSRSVQCSATTKKGKQCLRRTTQSNSRCWQHQ